MGMFSVEQRTKDGFFNATSLLKQWNKYITDNEEFINTHKIGYLKKKDLDDFFANKRTKVFLQALVDEEKLNSVKSTYVKTRGRNGGTWVCAILFIKFAMWINPRFEVQVIKFVYDRMIEFRNDAGDAYKELGSAVQKVVAPNFMCVAMKKVGEALNWIIFNKHEKALRNKHGDEGKMRSLFDLEREIAMLINKGFVKDYKGLIVYLRDEYKRRNMPAVFME